MIIIVPADQAEMLLNIQTAVDSYEPATKDIVIGDQEVTGAVTLAYRCACGSGHAFAAATVAECAAIVPEGEGSPDGWPIDWPLVEVQDGRVRWWPSDDSVSLDADDITDRIVGTVEVGQFALILTDVVKS